MADPVPTTQEIRDAIARDIAKGIQEVIVDGVTTRISDPRARMEALTELTEVDEVVNAPTRYPFGMKFVKFVPPGGG